MEQDVSSHFSFRDTDERLRARIRVAGWQGVIARSERIRTTLKLLKQRIEQGIPFGTHYVGAMRLCGAGAFLQFSCAQETASFINETNGAGSEPLELDGV